jgi:dihydroorotate dehydrogenase
VNLFSKKVWAASGAQGFFGEGYWFHWFWYLLGYRPQMLGFTAKTGTLPPRKGNMALTSNYTPRDWFPDCIVVNWWWQAMLNSVGIANPGLIALLATGRWQARTEPFWISVTSLAQTKPQRLEEYARIADILSNAKSGFSAPFGLQVNLSCPNTGHHLPEFIKESDEVLKRLSVVGVPLMPKYSVASTPISVAMELNQNADCAGICVSNTIPYDHEGLGQRIFKHRRSPLRRLGGGGISGRPLKSLVCNWIKALRDRGFEKHIHGGGGIWYPQDVVDYHAAGAWSIFLGTVIAQAAWRVPGLARTAESLAWK